MTLPELLKGLEIKEKRGPLDVEISGMFLSPFEALIGAVDADGEVVLFADGDL